MSAALFVWSQAMLHMRPHDESCTKCKTMHSPAVKFAVQSIA